ncbi:hypothetical protein [Mesorhizobium sp.]|uniref:hypothetical protein n=1 Tax=Mesorhizobium sp. TaxID=1871066 RepID=UPI0025D9D243|nr:hypothetical protein [Mesorhizobium sp.]
MAEANLCLKTGVLSTPRLTLVQPDEMKGKQVRVNSNDLHRSEQLAQAVFAAARKAKVVFAEVPVGSQSARAMASYGICIGILAALRVEGVQIIEVTAGETKKIFTGDKNAPKRKMIERAAELYPEANFPPMHKGQLPDKTEHLADAIATIHSGVRTPVFQNLLRLFQEV